MVDFVNPGVLGNVATFRRVFQVPIERSEYDCKSFPERLV